MRALQSLVGALRAPSPLVQVSTCFYQFDERGRLTLRSRSLKETVLDTFFEIFRINTPEWMNPFVSGKRLTRK